VQAVDVLHEAPATKSPGFEVEVPSPEAAERRSDDTASSIDTWQEPAPPHAPLQPVKVEPMWRSPSG